MPILNREQLADHFDLSPLTIDRWLKDGMPCVARPSRGVAGKFDLAACIKWWGNRQVENAVGSKIDDLAEIEKRTARAKMEMHELELAKSRGIVAPIADFERAVSKMCVQVQQNVMNVPQRVCNILLGCTDETEFKKALRAELAQALEVISSHKLDLENLDASPDEEEAVT